MSDEASPQRTFAEVFEQLRLARGLTAAGLARALGEYDGNISRWRRGKPIDLLKVHKIADFFGVDRVELARLAGYPDNDPSLGKDTTIDPEITALLEADRAYVREEFAGIPPAFWKPIVDARRIAGQLAIDNVKAALRIAREQSLTQMLSDFAARPNSTPAPEAFPSAQGEDSAAADDLTPSFAFPGPKERSAKNRLAEVAA